MTATAKPVDNGVFIINYYRNFITLNVKHSAKIDNILLLTKNISINYSSTFQIKRATYFAISMKEKVTFKTNRTL